MKRPRSDTIKIRPRFIAEMAEEEHFCKFLSHKSFNLYLFELIHSVTNGIETKHNRHEERFSIISFSHGHHSEKVPHFGCEYYKQS